MLRFVCAIASRSKTQGVVSAVRFFKLNSCFLTQVTQHVRVELIADVLYDAQEKAFNIMLEDPKGGASLDLSHCMVTVLSDEECSLVQFPKEAYPFMGASA